MKIGILTQPLYSNYGGLLQAWALQKTLVEMGHDAVLINRVYGKSKIPTWKKFVKSIKNEIYIFLGKRQRYLKVTDEIINISEENVIMFKESRYSGISPKLKTNDDFLDYIERNNYNAYVVGSDQVWRPKYSPNLMTYFLDFAKDNKYVKKIAYAASFGSDNWELTSSDTSQAKALANLFDLITVRESSGVDLVKKYLNCKAKHVLDPTMLRSKTDYQKLIEQSTCKLYQSKGNLFCYVLDEDSKLSKVIENCQIATGLKPFFCNYKIPFNRLKSHNDIEKCIVPPIEQWLKSFMDADMIITDSFHGTVFSIIFNKPFWVVSNEARGLARFTSLLKQFQLEDRILNSRSEINWHHPIDWMIVNNRRKSLSQYSKQLLCDALSK